MSERGNRVPGGTSKDRNALPSARRIWPMGGFLDLPKPARAPSLPAPALPQAQDTSGNLEQEQRQDQLERQRRGRLNTIATSPKGLLVLADWAPKRKSLLGE